MALTISTNLHLDYRDEVESVLGTLAELYPDVPLSAVEIFEAPRDLSMGHAADGVIYLNGYWFSRPRRFFTDAVMSARELTPPGFPLWHGGIGGVEQEFTRLLIHEFGHLLRVATPGAAEFAEAGSRAAVDDPSIAVSGYALADDDGSGEEWWSETFDAMILGGSDSPQVGEMREFLAGTR